MLRSLSFCLFVFALICFFSTVSAQLPSSSPLSSLSSYRSSLLSASRPYDSSIRSFYRHLAIESAQSAAARDEEMKRLVEREEEERMMKAWAVARMKREEREAKKAESELKEEEVMMMMEREMAMNPDLRTSAPDSSAPIRDHANSVYRRYLDASAVPTPSFEEARREINPYEETVDELEVPVPSGRLEMRSVRV